MNHLDEDQLILCYYGEAGQADEGHLRDCASCRAELEALERSLADVASPPVPERPANYGQIVWGRLERQLLPQSPSPPPSHPRWSWVDLFRPRRLGWAGATAVLVAVVFFGGRFSARWDSEPKTVSVAQIRERILLVALSEHLERSQVLLMELVNEDSSAAAPAVSAAQQRTDTIDISYERQRAEELVSDNRLYRQSADQAGESALASALDELERMLVDISHSPDNLNWDDFETLRGRIEAHGVLFKVKVLTTNVRERQRLSTPHKTL